MKQLPARTKSDNVVLIPEVLLNNWITSESQQYFVPSALLDYTHLMCPHGNIKPTSASKFKCIRRELVSELLFSRCGIHTTESVNQQHQHQHQVQQHQHNSNNLNNMEGVKDASNDDSDMQEDPWTKFNLENAERQQQQQDMLKQMAGARYPSAAVNNSSASTTTNVLDLDSWKMQQSQPSTPMVTIFNVLNASNPLSENNGGADYSYCQNGSRAPEVDNSMGLNLSMNNFAGRTVDNSYPNSRVSDEVTPLDGHLAHQQENSGAIDNNNSNVQLKEEAVEDESLTETIRDCPFLFQPSSFCRACVAKHANHILFLEKLRRFHRQFRREGVKHKISGCHLMGAESLESWPKVAVAKYETEQNVNLAEIKGSPDECSDFGEDEKDDKKSPPSLVNADIVCVHNKLNPQSYVSWIPMDSYQTIISMCEGKVHPATLEPDFELCPQCQVCVNY